MKLQCRMLSSVLKRYLSKNTYALHRLRELKFHSTIEDVCKTDLVFHIDKSTLLSCHISPQGDELYSMEACIEREEGFKMDIASATNLTEEDVFSILYWVQPLETKSFLEGDVTYLMMFVETLLMEGYRLRDIGNNHYRLQSVVPNSEMYVVRSNGTGIVDVISCDADKEIDGKSFNIPLQTFLEVMSGLLTNNNW